MTSTEIGSSQNTDQKIEDKVQLINTVEILNEDRQTILFEVLKCDICLALPHGKQVRICENGHHFCITCHEKMKGCGICRGKLLDVRNFVVEQLITKLAPILGLTENDSPVKTPAKPIPGSFKCLHNCPAKLSSFNMLSHLRLKHSNNFKEKVICNPYSNRFSLNYNIVFSPNESFVYSAFVADLGLCTIETLFLDSEFLGCCRLLVDNSALPHFKYQLVVKIPTSQMVVEYGVTDCCASHYSEDRESILKQGNLLKIKNNTFLEHINVGGVINVFFSIWRKNEIIGEKTPMPSISCLPERLLHINNDRRIRRNKNRNVRRKKKKSNK